VPTGDYTRSGEKRHEEFTFNVNAKLRSPPALPTPMPPKQVNEKRFFFSLFLFG